MAAASREYGISPTTVYKWIHAYSNFNKAGIIVMIDKTKRLAGKKKKFRRGHFEQLGNELVLTPKQIKGSFNRMVKNKFKAFDWIDRSFVSLTIKDEYKDLLVARYTQLGLIDL